MDFVNSFYVLLTLHLSIILDNDQLDTHLSYFTIRLLYVVWQKSNETDFLLTMNFILFAKKIIPFKIVPLGSYTVMEPLFPLFVAVLEGFCWYTFQLVG